MQLLSAFLTYIGKVPKIRGVITLTKKLTILGISTLIIVCTVVALAFLLGYGDSSDSFGLRRLLRGNTRGIATA